MNFTRYMNERIYSTYCKGRVLALGEKSGQYKADYTIDITGADKTADLNTISELPKGYDTIRMGEVLEHLVNDYALLVAARDALNSNGVLLVTVPYYGVAPYHVRLHNRWSIEQLLSCAGFGVDTYIPRKAPVIDRLIKYTRILPGMNALFFMLNRYLPLKPNGGYFVCSKGAGIDIAAINAEAFNA